MESISAGSEWTGESGGIGSLCERAFETFRDLRTQWRWRRQESGSAELQNGTGCAPQGRVCPSVSLNSCAGASAQQR